MTPTFIFLCISCIAIISSAHYLSLSVLEWKNASRFCQTYCNSHLISFHNVPQYVTALQLINWNRYIYKDVWIGLNDIQQSDQWTWSDGSQLDFGSNFGKYPWRDDEPDLHSIDDCIAIEATKNNEWIDKEQASNYHFLCNSCSSKLTKYVAINGHSTYNEANTQCKERFGTSLASIHNTRDMEEAITVCKSVTNTAGCWIGLNDKETNGIYKWEDGSQFDFGITYYSYPWYYTQPGSDITHDKNCVQLDPYPEQYLWDDANCNITGRTLCNAPSEICQETQFFISNEKQAANQWIWTKTPCAVMNNVINVANSVAIIKNKQYFNSNGVLLVDMMYTMTDIGLNGNAGVAFYFDGRSCDDYYIVGIWGDYNVIFLGKFVDGVWNVMKYVSIGIIYEKSTYYNIQIELTNGIAWNVKFNDKFMFNVTDVNDTFHNVGNKRSGYIGIRNSNASIIVKSLFISGDPLYINSNLLYLSCNNLSTTSPTVNPTVEPSMKPTRIIYEINKDVTTSTNIIIDIDDDHHYKPSTFADFSGLELFWIIGFPAICLSICAGVSWSINKYCCYKESDIEEIDDIMEGEDEAVVF